VADFAVQTEIRGRDRASRVFKKVGRSVRHNLKRAFGAAGRAAKKAMGHVARLSKKLLSLGPVAAGAAVVGITSLVKSVAESGDHLAKFSKRAGLTAQAYAEIRHAAGMAGTEAEQFDDAIRTFTKTIGEARRGMGPLAGLLKEVDEPFLKLLKTEKDNEKALNMVFEAMAKLEDPSKRAMLAAAAFGEVGQKMTLIVDGGTGALKAGREAFRKYAGVIDEKALKASEAFLDSSGNLSTAIEGVKFNIGSKLLPVLTPLITKLADWIAANRDLIGTKVSAFIEGIARWVSEVDWTEVLAGVKDFFTGVGQALEFLWDIRDVIKLIASAAIIGKLLGMWRKVTAATKAAGLAAAATGAQTRGAAGGAGGGVVAGGGQGKLAALGNVAAGVMIVGETMEALSDALGDDMSMAAMKRRIALAKRWDATFQKLNIDIGGKLVDELDVGADQEVWKVAAERMKLLEERGVEAARRGMGFKSAVVSEQLMETQRIAQHAMMRRQFGYVPGVEEPPDKAGPAQRITTDPAVRRELGLPEVITERERYELAGGRFAKGALAPVFVPEAGQAFTPEQVEELRGKRAATIGQLGMLGRTQEAAALAAAPLTPAEAMERAKGMTPEALAEALGKTPQEVEAKLDLQVTVRTPEGTTAAVTPGAAVTKEKQKLAVKVTRGTRTVATAAGGVF